MPIVTQTDGEWIWNTGHAYYLANYGLALEPDFHNHIRNKGYRIEEPSRERVVEALRFIEAEQAPHEGGTYRFTVLVCLLVQWDKLDTVTLRREP